ncbi:acetyl-CoA sensor PanZ family protein [Pseudomonas fluorescens]|uniref:GNAT family N-acetyltransferase n=1 Tax=Pseudomonas fluorescens TaxID=294 RepID=A0A423LUL0_PSEFL|nr:acetyl-CoA sensor PanZ family protein [Pseudomonas fluorescens]RON72000.1 GNAT family N-acetyltransferase [Pseudomonas fluorescens]
MPVIVQTLEDASYQDQQRIYRDAPPWLLAPFSGDVDLIESALADGSLSAGRLNDRLLGAGRLQRHNDVWYLSHLCVRKVTRHRGGAERLVNQAQKMASQAGAELCLLAPAGHLED